DEAGELQLGFHPPGRWEEVAPMDDCLLASERVEGARRQVLSWAREQGLSAYDRRSHEGLLRNLVVREGRRTGQLQVRLVTAAAIRNARLNEITNAQFFAGDVRLAMRELVERAGRPDVVVVDPPRAGLSAKIVRRLIEASPKRIVYVSCNPTTLAPNAAQLVEAGYALRRVRPVDMFPQTPHIECVALLERAG